MDMIGGKAQGRIEREIKDGVFTITVANATRHNAMSLAMWQEMKKAVGEAQECDGVRVIVVVGDGEKAFVSGADISEFGEKRNDPDNVANYNKAVDSAQAALRTSRIPTVAAIRGICFGGGMGLALSCDLRYASTGSRFRMPAGRLGLGYALPGVRRFVEVLGSATTADLFLTSRDFDGIEAARIGFVQQVFEGDVFEEKVVEQVNAISGFAPLTLETLKLSLRHIAGSDNAPSRDAVNDAVMRCFNSDDYREGQQAFAEKRKATFRGR